MSQPPSLSLSEADQQSANAELFELLRIPSVSADPAHVGDMQRAAEFLRAKLTALGFTARVESHRRAPGGLRRAPSGPRPAHRADLRPLRRAARSPAGRMADRRPLNPPMRDGRIYARGSTDDKGQAYAHLRGVELLLVRASCRSMSNFCWKARKKSAARASSRTCISTPSELACDVIVISDGCRFAAGRAHRDLRPARAELRRDSRSGRKS